VNIRFSLYSRNGGVEVRLYAFLTWALEFRFTLRPRYSLYPLDRRLIGPQNRSGRDGKRKIPAYAGNRTPFVNPETSTFTVSYPGHKKQKELHGALFLQKLIISQILKNSSPFIRPAGSLPCSQESTVLISHSLNQVSPVQNLPSWGEE
jgi:hypothetical protein